MELEKIELELEQIEQDEKQADIENEANNGIKKGSTGKVGKTDGKKNTDENDNGDHDVS